jgi:hypothetical protein
MKRRTRKALRLTARDKSATAIVVLCQTAHFQDPRKSLKNTNQTLCFESHLDIQYDGLP